MDIRKILFVLIPILTALLLYPHIISNINETVIPLQKEVKIVKLGKGQERIVSRVNRTSSVSRELFSSIKKEKRLDLFSNMEKRNAIEKDNFFGLNEYLSRDGFTLNFPIDRSLHLTTSLSPLNLEQGTKLSLKHRNRLAIFDSEMTLGFTGDYGLRFGLTRHF